jgi:Icc-related predicted phosphoesterase
MKIQILSDLHIEFGSIILEPVERDLLVLAGDIHVGVKAADFIEEQTEISKVIFVLGNHEFYQYDFDEVLRDWSEINAQNENLYFLEQERVKIGNIDFFGCTLWSDFENRSIKAMNLASDYMMDYQVIYKNRKRLAPSDTLIIHDQSVSWLKQSIQDSIARTKVVITHHLPSFQSVSPQFYDSQINGAFYSNLDGLIETTKPDLWIHGHTHDSFNYKLFNTTIVCNPRGYVNFELNPKFNPNYVYEI